MDPYRLAQVGRFAQLTLADWIVPDQNAESSLIASTLMDDHFQGAWISLPPIEAEIITLNLFRGVPQVALAQLYQISQPTISYLIS